MRIAARLIVLAAVSLPLLGCPPKYSFTPEPKIAEAPESLRDAHATRALVADHAP